MKKDHTKQIILNCEKLETRFALLSDGALEEYRIERKDSGPKVGSIYLGKIVNLETSLQAAFVDIGAEKHAFLHFHDMIPESFRGNEEEATIAVEKTSRSSRKKKSGSRSSELEKLETARRRGKFTAAEIPEFFKPGMEILVQVEKSPISTKGARVTANISIAGRYLVLMPYSDHIGLSSRIDNETERTRLKKILGELDLPEGMGLICRTVGEGRKSVFFKRDLDLLLDSWNTLEKEVDSGKAPCLVYEEPDLLSRSVRDFMTEEIGDIIVDDKDQYKKIHATVKAFGGRAMASRVQCYKKPEPIFEHFKINEQLQEVYRREVRLPSGGWLCIEETEALIAIDVNTGKGRRTDDQPELILKTNLEAVTEIARQLRLRNVGGLVVLDLIDMRSARDRDEVYKTMKKLVKDDRAKTKVLPISKFGLMEMTRQREEESILDKVYDPCPYCNGTGLVKSPMTVSVEIQRSLNAIFKNRRFRDVPVRVIIHPDVLARLRNDDAALLDELEQKYGHALSFRADPTIHCEEFRLIDPDTGAEIK
ncbi:MAG: Rne/Rng family ribonuclease [Lentisphaeria bacterium]|nr:Rne/Rng family ribonuclease [Lentisphaeria bacterium]